MIIAKNIVTATFIRRPNRFLGYVNLNGKEISCFIPDPGRLKELLYEGKIVSIDSIFSVYSCETACHERALKMT